MYSLLAGVLLAVGLAVAAGFVLFDVAVGGCG